MHCLIPLSYNIRYIIFTIKGSRLLGEMPNSVVGQGKHKRSLEHLVIPESKKVSPLQSPKLAKKKKKKDRRMSKRHRGHRDQLKKKTNKTQWNN